MKPAMTVAELAALTSDTSRGRKRSINSQRTIGRVLIDLESRIAKAWLCRETERG